MTIIYILQVLFGFGFVIAIHEAGHFFAAKRVGITCPAFSIGFPFPVWTPKGWKAFNIFKFSWRGTEYRLGWIPFGGYVTMHGQSDSPGQIEEAKEDDEGDYRNKSYWQKTQVLLGGVTMNAITAVIGFILAFQLGVTFIEPTVGMVDQSSDAWMENKIQVGDRILEVNGREVVDFEDVVYAGIFDGGDTIDLLIEREEDGKSVRKNVTIKLEEDATFGLKLPSIKAKHRVVLTGDEAERFPEGLGDDRPQDGDEIIAVNGRKVRNATDALGFLEVSRGKIELTLQRGFDEDARQWKVTYEPQRKYFVDSSPYIAGVSLSPTPWVDRIRKDGAADRAGIQKGDRIIGVRAPNGEFNKFNAFGDLTSHINATNGNETTLVIERGGKKIDLAITPDERESRPGMYQLAVTVTPFNPLKVDEDEVEEKVSAANRKVIAYGVRPGSDAAKNGMVPGDRIVGVEVDGREFTNEENGEFDRFALQLAFIDAAQGDEPKEITYMVQRKDGVEKIAVTPDDDGPDSGAYMLITAAEQRSDPVTYGLGESIVQGFYHSKKVGYKILMTLGALFTGRVQLKHLGGPIVIAKRSYSLAQWGIGTLIFFLAFISVNLAIVNLLPIPVLDGGQWLIVTIEALRGKPLPERAMHWVSFASFLAVVGLMLFVLVNDAITVWIRGWV